MGIRSDRFAMPPTGRRGGSGPFFAREPHDGSSRAGGGRPTMRGNVSFSEATSLANQQIAGSVTAGESLELIDCFVQGGVRGHDVARLENTNVAGKTEATESLQIRGGVFADIRAHDALELNGATAGRLEVTEHCAVVNSTTGKIRGHDSAQFDQCIVNGHVEMTGALLLANTQVTMGGVRAHDVMTADRARIVGDIEASGALALKNSSHIEGDVRAHDTADLRSSAIAGKFEVSGRCLIEQSSVGSLKAHDALVLQSATIHGDVIASAGIERVVGTTIAGGLETYSRNVVVDASEIGSMHFKKPASIDLTTGLFGNIIIVQPATIFTQWWQPLLNVITLGLYRSMLAAHRAGKGELGQAPVGAPQRVELKNGTRIHGDIVFDGGNGTVVVDATSTCTGQVVGGSVTQS